MIRPVSIWIGYDPNEHAAFEVARASIRRRLKSPTEIRGVFLPDLVRRGLYTRPYETRINERGVEQPYDPISEHWMATQFAISRFLVPRLVREGFEIGGLALFIDCDMLARANFYDVFAHCLNTDSGKPLYCVKHDYAPQDSEKMGGLVQSAYACKNWSSFMVLDCDHEANAPLVDGDLVNLLPGRDLHRFCWLDDNEIGALDPAWNFLNGITSAEAVPDPKCVHFTTLGPWHPGGADVPYADEWRDELRRQVV